MIPHPEKQRGEDAYFVLPGPDAKGTSVNAAGVADGVGGWSDMGKSVLDPAIAKLPIPWSTAPKAPCTLSCAAGAILDAPNTSCLNRN